MKIVRAARGDVPRIAKCAREFCATLGQKFNEAHYVARWQELLGEDGVIFLMVDDQNEVAGGIGGLATTELLSGDRVAVELFWYVHPEFRVGTLPVRLLSRFEAWAKAAGCAGVSMIYMEKSMPERMREFYARSGYALQETVYTKKL